MVIFQREVWCTVSKAAFRSRKAMYRWRFWRNSCTFSMMSRRPEMWSVMERFGMKPACWGRLLLLMAGRVRVSSMRVKILGYPIKHSILNIFRLLYSNGAMIDCCRLWELKVELSGKNTCYSLPAVFCILFSTREETHSLNNSRQTFK